jgi:hypothetical protein
MKTSNIGIVLDKGSDFSLVIKIFNELGPVDISDYVFKSQMRANTDPASPVMANFSFDILNQTTNRGQVRWYLPKLDSDALILSVSNSLQSCRLTTPFVYDIKMKDASGVISRIIQGIVQVSPDTTQGVF